jgi:RsiW-degrading membrane proteinase PrsW (M82 family)
MILFALSVAPGIAISLYFFFRDEYNREPRKHILFCFFLGILAAIPAAFFQWLILPVVDRMFAPGAGLIAVKAFFIVALSEEWCKYIMVRYYAFRQPEFDEPFDGIVYTVMVGMGFATIENIGYVMQHGLATAILRMFLSVPAHAAFAILMGYYVGHAKFNPKGTFPDLMKGLWLAVFFHGLFDFFLFLRDHEMIQKHVSDIFLFAGALVTFIISLFLSRRATREHIAHSREKWTGDDRSQPSSSKTNA